VNEFRSAIAALDLNKDGIDDLLVADGKDRLEVILSVP
jgi:FG-GAP repeat